jgi:hypothetical protein
MKQKHVQSQHRGGRIRFLIGGGLVLVLGLALWLAWPGPGGPPATVDPSAAGRLEATETMVDLGRVPFDKPVEARFELANSGGSPVRLIGKPQVKLLEGC